METVSFTRMDEGTIADYQLTERLTRAHTQAHLVDNVLGLLRLMEGSTLGHKIDRTQHSLQCATRALRDEADEEMVVVALLHDIGDVHAPENHSALAAAVLRPYVSADTHWLVLHHGVFQGYHYFDKIGADPNARERYRGHPCFEKTALFCERWDQRSFDPAYDTLPLAAFEPMVRRRFARPLERHV